MSRCRSKETHGLQGCGPGLPPQKYNFSPFVIHHSSFIIPSPFPLSPSAFYNTPMSYRCLADFLEELGQAGELARVEAEVDPVLEAAEITDRVAKANGPALLFGAAEGHDFPLLTNLLGTEGRICRALGVKSLVETRERIAGLLDPAEPEGWFEKLKTAPTPASLAKLPPRPVKTGPCQQVVKLGGDVDLGELPAIQSRPGETGRAITAGVTVFADVDSPRRSVGRYDLGLLAPDRLAACWGPQDEPARLLAGYRRRSERMPVAVVLGGDPLGMLAAMAPVPPDIEAFALAGLLRQRPLDVVACRTVKLSVPAEAEIVIEGHVDPAEPPIEAGPPVTPIGCYSFPRPLPVIHVTAITHRANPIYPAMVPGAREACVVSRALGQIFLPLVRLAIRELVDYDFPAFGAGRHWGFVSIRKTYAGQARRVAHAAWGLPQWMFAKLLVVVDEDVDVHDYDQVWSAVAVNVDPGRDVIFQQGPPDPLDPATPPGQLGHKMAMDATAKLPQERSGDLPHPAVMSEETRRLVSERWSQYGLGVES